MFNQILIRGIFFTFISVIISSSNSFALPTNDCLYETIENGITKQKKNNTFQRFIKRIAQKKAAKKVDEPDLKNIGLASLILGLASPALLFLALFFGFNYYAIGLAFTLLIASMISGLIAIYLGVKTLLQNKKNKRKRGSKAAIFGLVLGSLMTAMYLVVTGLILFQP